MTDVAVTENTYELPVVKSELPATSYESIDYDHFLDCVHCGLCTAACPTYAELGNENDSPRGRIYLMRAVRDGRAEMDDTVRGHLELFALRDEGSYSTCKRVAVLPRKTSPQSTSTDRYCRRNVAAVME